MRMLATTAPTTPSTPARVFARTRLSLALALGLGAAFTLSACGSDSTSDATAQQDTQQDAGQGTAPSGAPGAGQGGGGFAMPGASGLIAAVDGSTMQVQSQSDGQVAVTWTDKTTFTQQVSAALADVTVGSCVFVSTGDSGSADSSDAGAVTAASVRISESCDQMGGGPGQGGGEPPSGMPTDMPSDMPTDMPSDMAGGPGQGGGFGGAVGEVTAVSKDGFTVKSTFDDSTTEVSVTSETAYTTTAATTAKSVTVGSCATAMGESDNTGAVTADSIALTEATNGECGMGMRP